MKTVNPHITAIILGIGGLLPFAIFLSFIWITDNAKFTEWFICYGAIILSFTGAILWGIALFSSFEQSIQNKIYPNLS